MYTGKYYGKSYGANIEESQWSIIRVPSESKIMWTKCEVAIKEVASVCGNGYSNIIENINVNICFPGILNPNMWGNVYFAIIDGNFCEKNLGVLIDGTTVRKIYSHNKWNCGEENDKVLWERLV
jgi:hypothetical protein